MLYMLVTTPADESDEMVVEGPFNIREQGHGDANGTSVEINMIAPGVNISLGDYEAGDTFLQLYFTQIDGKFTLVVDPYGRDVVVKMGDAFHKMEGEVA
jgi:hypothetical protein